MILLGSQAARIRGCFPTWRNPKESSDWDFHGTHAELFSMKKWLEQSYSHLVTIPKPNNRYGFYGLRNCIIVEFDVLTPERLELIECLADNSEALVLGHLVKVIGPRTQLLVKESFSRFPIHTHKTRQDMEFWRSNPEWAQLTPEHERLRDALWEESERKFAPRFGQ